MASEDTYELKISLPQEAAGLKSEVIDFLQKRGEWEFVEGCLDELDEFPDYEGHCAEHYHRLGGQESPLYLYKEENQRLAWLKEELESAFSDKLQLELRQFPSHVWQEGWKESFKPVQTSRFYIYPPWWVPTEEELDGRLGVEIDPGMAFGTGQHETTKLCLEILGDLDHKGLEWSKMTMLDLGVGSGVLAIAAAKLGVRCPLGVDIDPDALKASRDNIARNDVRVDLQEGSESLLSNGEPRVYDLVVANILGFVLKSLFPSILAQCHQSSYLLLSGILFKERQEFIRLGQDHGLELREERKDGDWVALLFQPRASSEPL